MDTKEITFYFDPVSPYAWLASTQLGRIADATKRNLVARPILFAGLLKAHGHQGPAEIPAKRNYIFRDVMRRANFYKLDIEGPPRHPFNPLLALRVCTAIDSADQRLRFSKAIMQAAWGEGLDITDASVVTDVVKNCGLEGAWALESANNQETKAALVTATDQAVQQGLFGVPSFVVDGQLFWGDDRIDDVIGFSNRHEMGDEQIDELKLQKILAREAAHRSRNA